MTTNKPSVVATVKKVAYGNVELLEQIKALQAECDALRALLTTIGT